MADPPREFDGARSPEAAITTDRFDIEAARRALSGTRFADLAWVESTGSTNSDLLASGEGERALVADVQTSGRGRRGRRWVADEGTSLLMSVRVQGVAEAPMNAQIALALALVDHCSSRGASVALKWPNDVITPNGKLAGLLAESSSVGGRAEAVVVGIGVNVDWGGAPPEGAVDLASIGVDTTRHELAVALLTRMERHLARDPAELRRLYEAACSTLGSEVRVEQTDRTIVGTAVRLGRDGSLVVRADDGEHTLHVGEVIHLR